MPSVTDLIAPLRSHLSSGEPAVLVRVTKALGSTPREAGAAMLVTWDMSIGTVGGGALELSGIDRARAMIAAGESEAVLAVPLGPRIGQCCGGHVTLALSSVTEALVAEEIVAEAERRALRPAVLIFGAGHTGRALASALAPLPLRVRVVDTRRDSLAGLPEEVEIVAAALPEAEVDAAPAGTAFLVMTHDHGLDFLIAAAALSRGDAAYVGMIGSATKRETFRRHLVDAGLADVFGGLTLPIGGSAVRDKRPEVIAALVAAELVVALLSPARSKRTEEKQALPFAGGASQCNSDASDFPLPKAAHASAP
ncbi:MAG: xanthine dehydrogenase accessory protein XdhC [Rhizobiaceae bacterium]|nr:xanthine dehydrogenase accessory protein XdhC [Rhizobiaceae bacterium]